MKEKIGRRTNITRSPLSFIFKIRARRLEGAEPRDGDLDVSGRNPARLIQGS